MQRPATADYPAGAQLATRRIPDYELVWMLRGRAEFVTTRRLPFGPGELLLVPPGLEHGFVWDPRRPSRHGYVHFDATDASVALPSVSMLCPMSAHDPLAGLCAYLVWLGGCEHPRWRPRALETLGLVLDILLAGPLPGRAEAIAPPLVLAAAVDLLRTEWAEFPLRRVAVEELMAVSHVSRSSLNRMFRESFGLPAGRALELARCSRAEAMITHSDMPLERVAWQCGFADAAHLSHRFSHLYGAPPGSFRNARGSFPSALEDPGVRRLARLIWE